MIHTITAQHAPSKPTATTAGWPALSALIIVIAASVAIFFGQLGAAPLFNPDEGLYAEPAREMLDTGEYITTLLNYSVRFTKPPLAIWLMALSYKVFGINEFAARFPGALSAVLLVVVTYLFLARFVNVRSALLAALTLVSAPMCIGVARMAITDMPLALFTAGGLMAFFTAFANKNRPFVYLGYLLVGLAVMTKGPVGALLPVLVLACFHILTGSFRDAIKFYDIPLGVLIVAVVTLPWFIVEIYLTKGAYFQEFILRENFQRFTSVVDSHKGGWWYHIAAMFAGFFPWSIFLVQAIAFIGLEAGRYRFGDPHGGRAAQAAPTKQDVIKKKIRLFSLCWLLITLLFFSVSVSKLFTYTLPAFPALAALVALELDQAIEAGKRSRLLLPFCLIALSFALSAVGSGWALDHMRETPVELAQVIASFAGCVACASLICLSLVFLRRQKEAVYTFAIGLVILILSFGGPLLRGLSVAFEGDVPDYARRVARSSAEIIVFDLRKPAIPFYTRRKVVLPANRDELNRMLKVLKDAYIITRTRDLKFFEQMPGCTVMAKDTRFALICWKSAR